VLPPPTHSCHALLALPSVGNPVATTAAKGFVAGAGEWYMVNVIAPCAHQAGSDADPLSTPDLLVLLGLLMLSWTESYHQTRDIPLATGQVGGSSTSRGDNLAEATTVGWSSARELCTSLELSTDL
jgi:hypothetical protein